MQRRAASHAVRSLSVGLLFGWLALIQPLTAQPAPPGSPEAAAKAEPARRALSPEDGRRVGELENKILELRVAGQFAEAVPLAQSILDLRGRALGMAHWETADTRRLIRTLEMIAAAPAAAQTQLKEAEMLDRRCSEMEQRGQHAQAVPPLERVVSIRQRHQGAEHPETAKAVERLAFFVGKAGDQRRAEMLYRQALAINRKVLGNDHPDTAKNLENLGMCLHHQGKYPEAEPVFREALAICRRQLGADDPETAKKAIGLASALYSLGKYAESETLYRQALAISRRVHGEDHPLTVTSYNGLALTLSDLNKPAEAERLLRQLVAIELRAHGENHADTATLYNNLGICLHEQGKFAEAEPWFRQALAISQKVLGADHPKAAIYAGSVAMVLYNRGEYAGAEVYLRQALAVSQKALGDNHPQTAICANNLANSLECQGRHEEAGPLLRHALVVCRRVRGEEHPHTLMSYNNVAMNLHAQGQYAQADPLLRHVLAVTHRVQGVESAATARAFNNLALNLQMQGRYAEAEPLFRQTLAIDLRVHGEDHPNTAMTYNNLATNLGGSGQRQEAERLLRHTLALRRRLLGENHPDTAQSYHNLAAGLSASGRLAEAEALYRQALAIRRDRLGEAHPKTALTYENVAINLMAQGRLVEAREPYERALAICRRVLGETHPETARCYHQLASLSAAEGQYDRAEELWLAAARSYETMRPRTNLAGLDRVGFTSRHSPLSALAALLARRGKAEDAGRWLETNLARGLFDDLSARQARPLEGDERRREEDLLGRLQQLDKQLTAIASTRNLTDDHRRRSQDLEAQRLALQAEYTTFESELARKYGPLAGTVHPLQRIQASLPPHGALVTWLDLKSPPGSINPNGEHWACVIRPRGVPLWIQLRGSGRQGAWTEEDEGLPANVRRSLLTPPDETDSPWRAATGRLYRQRLEPLARTLGARSGLPPASHLIILPSTSMNGVPVEALVAARTDGQPPYTVSYAPSGTVYAWLREQGHAKSARPGRLLALGDPVFERPTGTIPTMSEPPDYGVLITKVTPDSNAALAGLRPGDVILEYAERKLATTADLTTALLPGDGQPPAENRSAARRVPLVVWRGGRIESLAVAPGKLGITSDRRPAAEAIRDQRTFAAALERTRGDSFIPLPGTRHEVEAIARLFPQATTLLGSEASEQRLDELARSGLLRGFDVLHLATHGRVDHERAMHSGLVLSQDRLPDPLDRVLAGQPAYDGILTAEQIARTWKLDADLVTLSACETVGKAGGGEGYLGFAQALFVAGGRSLVLSQWPVNDTATALLMARFYENLLGSRSDLAGPLPKAAALDEAKRWLRRLTIAEIRQRLGGSMGETRGERPKETAVATAAVHPFDHPYYWSAFILIGDPGDLPQAESPKSARKNLDPVATLLLLLLALGGITAGRGLRPSRGP